MVVNNQSYHYGSDARMVAGVIYEGVIATINANGSAHLTPLGFRRADGQVLLKPFVPSVTLDNLRRHPYAVMNLTTDVRVTAGCLTGHRDWPVERASHIDGWRLTSSLAAFELAVLSDDGDAARPTFGCEIVATTTSGVYAGFNRAQAAVVEAAILVSRLDFIEPAKLVTELEYLSIAIGKTAGPDECTAWHWLLDAVAAHPRHQINSGRLKCR